MVLDFRWNHQCPQKFVCIDVTGIPSLVAILLFKPISILTLKALMVWVLFLQWKGLISTCSFQLSFIYIAPNYNNSCFKVLIIVKRLHIVSLSIIYLLLYPPVPGPLTFCCFNTLLSFAHMCGASMLCRRSLSTSLLPGIYTNYTFVGIASLSIVSHSCDLRIEVDHGRSLLLFAYTNAHNCHISSIYSLSCQGDRQEKIL